MRGASPCSLRLLRRYAVPVDLGIFTETRGIDVRTSRQPEMVKQRTRDSCSFKRTQWHCNADLYDYNV